MGHLSIFDQLQPQKSLPGGGLFMGCNREFSKRKRYKRIKQKKFQQLQPANSINRQLHFFLGPSGRLFYGLQHRIFQKVQKNKTKKFYSLPPADSIIDSYTLFFFFWATKQNLITNLIYKTKSSNSSSQSHSYYHKPKILS